MIFLRGLKDLMADPGKIYDHAVALTSLQVWEVQRLWWGGMGVQERDGDIATWKK